MIDFEAILRRELDQYEIEPDDKAVSRLVKYYQLLITWNEKINLTALTAPVDVALKHFVDCLMILKYTDISKGASVIDVGTGAGFPGVVLKIARPDINLVLLDSLQKRLDFLEMICAELELDKVSLIHSRAEDAAKCAFRNHFDVVVSRAVAPMNILCEYDMPYVHIGGKFIAMKGKDADAELAAAEHAIAVLGGKLLCKHDFILGEAGERSIIEIGKVAPTPDQYPRRSKAIQSKPL